MARTPTTNRYRFVTNCIAAHGDDISALKETGEEVSRQTFARALGPEQWAWIQDQLGYSKDFRITTDWHVGYYRGIYRGVPAFYLVHSHIEYVFTLNGKQGPSLSTRRR